MIKVPTLGRIYIVNSLFLPNFRLGILVRVIFRSFLYRRNIFIVREIIEKGKERKRRRRDGAEELENIVVFARQLILTLRLRLRLRFMLRFMLRLLKRMRRTII